MKSLLPATLIGLLMFGYGESTAEVKGQQPSIVAEVDEVVGWVMDNYTSMEDAFAESENAIRSSDAPVDGILRYLEKLVSGKRAESEGMKDQLLVLKKKLEDRKKKIELAAGKASPSLRESYVLAIDKMEVKLEGKIKPLLDFDFPNLENFEKDLSASTLEWKEYLGNVNGVLDESLIRNELANRISEHFEEKMAKAIEERRSKWASVVKARNERVQKEQIDGRPPFVDNLARPHEDLSQTEKEILKPYPKQFPPSLVQEPVQKVEKNVSGARFASPVPRFEMISVKPGSFAMGSPGGFFAGERGRDSDESQHQVTLTKGFYLGKYEVTQAQWVHVMGSNPSQFKGTNRPVEDVSWNDAVAFCKKLTEMERRAGRLPAGMAYQLPTEAQWEYVCRSGTTSAFSFGQDLTSRQANISGGPAETTEVGKYPANAWGLHDMHGNVWEWCADWYAEYPKGGDSDPTGSMKGAARVTRGGSWDDSASDARCASRNSRAPVGSYGGLGFRLSLQ